MDRDYVLAPQMVKVGFALAPVFAQTQSLVLLNETEQLFGLGEWVRETQSALTPAQRRENAIIFEGGFTLIYDDLKRFNRYDNLTQYIDSLVGKDPTMLVRRAAEHWREKLMQPGHDWQHPLPDPDALLEDRAVFIEFMQNATECPNSDDIWGETFDLFQQPSRFIERMQTHIHEMWDHYLRAEWEKSLPMLQESLQAFQRLDYSGMTVLEAMRTVTGRDLQSKLKDEEHTVDAVIFTPSPHLGPYISRYQDGDTLRVMYGARLPRGVQSQSSALSRSEVLIRMNALADDTRLRILELLTRTDELCAQDIIESLGLSQSTVSRHLGQLTASGFLVERRREVNKCYSLNTDRVVDTVRALTNFLTRQ
jgi:DNA-binding transcriptional ArsR family regulator